MRDNPEKKDYIGCNKNLFRWFDYKSVSETGMVDAGWNRKVSVISRTERLTSDIRWEYIMCLCCHIGTFIELYVESLKIEDIRNPKVRFSIESIQVSAQERIVS